MEGGTPEAHGLRPSASFDERDLERRLLPSVAERARLGFLILASGCLFPIVGDLLHPPPELAHIQVIEFARVAIFVALAIFVRPSRSDTASSAAILVGIATLAASTAWVGVIREDLGPYMIVTVGLALACSVSVPWTVTAQIFAVLILTTGLVASLLAMVPQDRWTMATANSVFAFLMSMGTSVLVTVFDTQRRRATREALERTIRAREELSTLNDRLEQRVEERTRALAEANRELGDANVRLGTSNRDLEAAYRELEGFTHSVSHDLRVPLRVINGLSRLALEEHGDGLGEEGRGYLSRIVSETVLLGEVGDGLLTLARVTRVPIVIENVDLSRLAREVAAALAASTPERRVDLRIEDGLRVDGEPELLRIVVEQLLSNAWKFTRHRGAARIEMGASDEDGHAGFFVKDNGSGFAPEFAGKLFRPFERIHDDASVEGRGIGLAIAHRIVTRHGGRIRAKGEAGHGATFYVFLPRTSA